MKTHACLWEILNYFYLIYHKVNLDQLLFQFKMQKRNEMSNLTMYQIVAEGEFFLVIRSTEY